MNGFWPARGRLPDRGRDTERDICSVAGDVKGGRDYMRFSDDDRVDRIDPPGG